jgi:predicted ATP-dependent endonuclease of OLD family
MRIDRLEIKNFKKFSDYTLELHSQFTLLVGNNGTGKTTILDALAIASGVWLVNALIQLYLIAAEISYLLKFD